MNQEEVNALLQWSAPDDRSEDFICPYCGYIHLYAPGASDDENGEDDCLQCGKPIVWRRIITVTYVTSIKDEE